VDALRLQAPGMPLGMPCAPVAVAVAMLVLGRHTNVAAGHAPVAMIAPGRHTDMATGHAPGCSAGAAAGASGAHRVMRLDGGGGRADGRQPARLGSPPRVERTRSLMWFEGYRAGQMQFLQSYTPDAIDGRPLVIGMAGGTGSGKTTIKEVILDELSQPTSVTGEGEIDNVAVLSHDNYYRHRPDLTDEERDRYLVY
jgi:hypothetical protein